MHPRNLYNRLIDFKDLSLKFPEFAEKTQIDFKGKIKIDFNDHESRRILTKCCLHKDFNLTVELPKNRLCPTLPLRLNYLHFIEDLLEHCDIKDNVTGVDIGCGSCCIYCLLAVRINTNWNMIGLEMEKLNIQQSRANVEKNGLENRIKIIDQENSQKIFDKLFENDNASKAFCMCNPPFYSSEDEMMQTENRTGKRRKLQVEFPSHETVVDGGETAFVTKILLESIELKDKIQIYSTMIGCKRNFDNFMEILKENNIENFTTTKFIQGKVQRWGVAWSFNKNLQNFKDHICISQEKSSINVLKYEVENMKMNEIIEKANEIFTNLKIEIEVIEEDINNIKWHLHGKDNTWSNQRRKRRAEKMQARVEVIEKQVQHELKLDNSIEQSLTLGFEIISSNEKITIEMYFMSGSMTKDSANQILQYIKNHMK